MDCFSSEALQAGSGVGPAGGEQKMRPSDATIDQIKTLIEIQSLLQKLKNDEVQAQFVVGNIITAEDPKRMLLSLGTIYELLFPEWTASATIRETVNKSAAKHFQLLVRHSHIKFELPCAELFLCEHSYSTWMNTLVAIRKSTYWRQSGSLGVAMISHSEWINTSQVSGAARGTHPVGAISTPLFTERESEMVPDTMISLTKARQDEYNKSSLVSSQNKNPSTEVEPVNMSMRSCETLRSYCLRYYQTASANHHGKFKWSIQRLKTFITTTPEWFKTAIQRRLLIKRLLKQDDHLTWNLILEEADRQDRNRKERGCIDAAENVEESVKGRCHFVQVPGKISRDIFGSRIFKNSKYGRATTLKRLACLYCERVGHNEDSCWRKQLSCLMCGNPSHHFTQCKKYLPNYRQTHQHISKTGADPLKCSSDVSNSSADRFAVNISGECLFDSDSSILGTAGPLASSPLQDLNLGSALNGVSLLDSFQLSKKDSYARQKQHPFAWNSCLSDQFGAEAKPNQCSSNYGQLPELEATVSDNSSCIIPNSSDAADHFDKFSAVEANFPGVVLSREGETWDLSSNSLIADHLPPECPALPVLESPTFTAIDGDTLSRTPRQTSDALGDVRSSPRLFVQIPALGALASSRSMQLFERVKSIIVRERQQTPRAVGALLPEESTRQQFGQVTTVPTSPQATSFFQTGHTGIVLVEET